MKRLAVLFGAFLVIGCPGNQKEQDVSQAGPPQTTTSTSNPQAVPEKSTSMNPITPPAKEIAGQRAPAPATIPIQVQLTEYEIQMPDAITSGSQTFHVVNSGHYNHNFAIEGNGISQKLASDLPRGDSSDMTVKLAPGTYTVYCPVDKHRGRGMQRTITVK